MAAATHELEVAGAGQGPPVVIRIDFVSVGHEMSVMLNVILVANCDAVRLSLTIKATRRVCVDIKLSLPSSKRH